MGPCFRGMENSPHILPIPNGGDASMGPCFRGMENVVSVDTDLSEEEGFNGAML